MNKCIAGNQVETLNTPLVREEAVDLVRKVRAELQRPDPERENRVNELHAQIKGGAYEVSSQTMASDILETLERSRREDG